MLSVIETYLRLKWANIRNFFFLLVYIYITFVFVLSFYVLLLIQGSTQSSLLFVMNRYILIVTSSGLLCHAIIQVNLIIRNVWQTFILIIHSLTHWLTISWTRGLTVSLNHRLTPGLTDSLPDSWTRWLNHSLTRSQTHALTDSLTHSLTDLLLTDLFNIQSLGRSIAQSFSCWVASPPY